MGDKGFFGHRLESSITNDFLFGDGEDQSPVTAGIGENSPFIRAGSCEGLKHIGIEVNAEKNNRSTKKAFAIQTEDSPVKVLVIPTNEELEIAEQTIACINDVKS